MNHLRAWGLVAALALSLGTAVAEDFSIEGKYELVVPPQPTETGDKVEVLDVFWYGCPHCYSFLPALESYEKTKADYVEMRRMPAVFRKNWENHARAYYTAKLLGVEHTLHRKLFEAIHKDGKRMDTPRELRAFFVANGVEGEAFDKTFDSFAVETLLRKSMVMQGRYGVRGTPSVGLEVQPSGLEEALDRAEHAAGTAARCKRRHLEVR